MRTSLPTSVCLGHLQVLTSLQVLKSICWNGSLWDPEGTLMLQRTLLRLVVGFRKDIHVLQRNCFGSLWDPVGTFMLQRNCSDLL